MIYLCLVIYLFLDENFKVVDDIWFNCVLFSGKHDN